MIADSKARGFRPPNGPHDLTGSRYDSATAREAANPMISIRKSSPQKNF